MKQAIFFIVAVISKRIEESSSNVGWAKRHAQHNRSASVGHGAIAPLPNLQFKPVQNHPSRLGKAPACPTKPCRPMLGTSLSRLCPTYILPRKSKAQGFSYVEVLVATMLIAIALVPAINALQAGIQSTGIHQSLTIQHYQRLQKMEELQTEPYSNLLAAAKTGANKTTATSYSDASGASNRRVVFMALYDADADPFTLIDPNTDGDNNLYTGSTANLLWIRVETEGTAQGLETLVSR